MVTYGETNLFAVKVLGALENLEARTSMSDLTLTVTGISPDGPLIGYDIRVEPAPPKPELERFQTEVKAILAEFEKDVGLWVDSLRTDHHPSHKPTRTLSGAFRQAY